MNGQPNMTDLRRRLEVIQQQLKVDADTKMERVELSDLAHARVFQFIDELAVAIDKVQSQIQR